MLLPRQALKGRGAWGRGTAVWGRGTSYPDLHRTLRECGPGPCAGTQSSARPAGRDCWCPEWRAVCKVESLSRTDTHTHTLYIYTHRDTCLYTHTHTHLYTYTLTYIHTHTHTHPHTHTHTLKITRYNHSRIVSQINIISACCAFKTIYGEYKATS